MGAAGMKRAGDRLSEHTRLGHSVKLNDGNECSLCGGECPKVPLMLWNESGNVAWRYCDKCAEEVYRFYIWPRRIER
jgi:hypothetical protein